MAALDGAETDLVDAAERQRIKRTGLNETLFVEAGAGTGKTRELVHRVVNLVVHTAVPLSGIAAITFTEAAAAELRDRIREELEHRLANHPTDQDRATYDQALAEVDEAAIGTLHGFCLRILSEHPLAVDLPARVEVLDEVSSQLAFQQRWERFVDELYDDVVNEQLVLRAWALGIEIHTTSRNKASLKDVASIFDDSWDRLDELLARPPKSLIPIDLTPVAEALRDMRELLGTNAQQDDKLFDRVQEVDQSAGEVLAEADPIRQLRLLCGGHGGWKAHGRLGQARNWENIGAVRTAVTAVGDRGREIVEQVSDDVLRQLSAHLARFTRAAAERRREEGRLDFHDLLVLARRLLRTSAEARATLHDRYQRLLLDEFQDIDPIQIEVAVLIAAAAVSGDADLPWPAVSTDAGRLFFVGDPKQSIYRFRRADIELFLTARDHFGGPDLVLLRQNFRTVKPVVEWVNHAFGSMMGVEVPGQQAAYQPLSAHRPGRDGTDHRVALLGGPTTANAGDLRELEAASVAATISSIGRDPHEWAVFDKRIDAWRDPVWADVTILIPTRTSLRQLEDALDRQGVPYRVATGSLVFDTQEVREALDALRAIADPGDELALVSALRSPLYACSDVDLFTYRNAAGRWDLGRSPAGVPAEHPVRRAIDHLRSLADLRWWHEPSALLERLLRERNAFALAFGSRRHREVWRRLRFIVDQARAFEELGGGGVLAFLDWADLQRSEGTRVHEPLRAETDDDAVSILTIHGAKGLEFAITVVSGATTEMKNKRSGPQVFWEDGVPEVRLKKGAATENFDRLADLEAEMDEYERRRLLYVACTRARDHLVLSTFHKPGSASYGKWLTDASADVEGTLCRRLALEEDEPHQTDAASAAPAVAPQTLTRPATRNAWLPERTALLEAQRRPRFVSATTIAADASRAAAEQYASEGEEQETPGDTEHRDNADDVRRPEIPWRRGRAGTAIGRAVHAVLQVVSDAADDVRLVELATQQAHVEAVPDAVHTIAALARSALRAPSVVAAHAAERCWRELYVAAPLGERAIEGYIDLLYETPKGLVLVDYKTDSVANEVEVDAKAERYRLQAAAYAVALEESTGLRVNAAVLVFCTAGEPIERAVPDLAGGMEEVRQLVA